MMAAARPNLDWLRQTIRAARAFGGDARATAMVEAAFLLPAALLTLALLIYGAEGFAIQRKVTLTARTVTDLITQATPTQYSNGFSIVSHTTVDNALQVASAVMTPYASANLSMVASEVVVNSGGATATVQWSESYNGATARPANQVVTLPGTIGTGQVGNYFILGEVYYTYAPLNLFETLSNLTLSGAIYLTPRQSTGITCTNCAT